MPSSQEYPRDTPPASPKKTSKPPLEAQTSLESMDSEMGTSDATTDTEQQNQKNVDTESRSHAKTFARAANLLRESFGDLGEDGAVVFLTLKNRLDKPTRSPTTGDHPDPSSTSPSDLKRTNTSSNNGRPLAPQEAPILASSTVGVSVRQCRRLSIAINQAQRGVPARSHEAISGRQAVVYGRRAELIF